MISVKFFFNGRNCHWCRLTCAGSNETGRQWPRQGLDIAAAYSAELAKTEALGPRATRSRSLAAGDSNRRVMRPGFDYCELPL
jgi:aldehyde:ferredoxin oxidoreductase